MRFETEGLAYVEARIDFREGARLYDSAAVGRVHRREDGEDVAVENRLPGDFDGSGTARATFEMVVERPRGRVADGQARPERR